MIKKGYLTIIENTDIQPMNYSRQNPPNHPFGRGVKKKSIIDKKFSSNMGNNTTPDKNQKSALPGRKIVARKGFKKLVYMLSIASPEIVELLKKESIINPVHYIKNYLYNLHKLFRGRIQNDLGWKSGTWDDKIARIIKHDAPHRILTKAEVNHIYRVLELTIADFDDVCVHLGFTTQLTPSESDLFDSNSKLEYESLYGKFSKSCRPNLLRVYYDYIKYAQPHFATHFLALIGRGESEYYRTSKMPMLFVNDISLYVVADIEKMRLSFLSVKSHLQFLIGKRNSLDEFIDE